MKKGYIIFLLLRIITESNNLFSYENQNNDNKDIKVKSDKSLTAEENYSNRTGYSGKINFTYDNYNLIIMDFREYPGETDKTVISFYNPVFSAGRLKKTGLIKEMSNPSTWYAGSEIYTDNSGMKADTALKRNGEWGFLIQPMNNVFFYMAVDENNNYRVNEKGAGFKTDVCDWMYIEAAHNESVFKESVDDSWYFSRNKEYADNIYNTSVKCVLITGLMENTVSGGLSYGDRFKTGKYLRYQPVIRYDKLSVFLLLSFSDYYYRKPVNGYPSVKLRRGFKTLYELNNKFQIESGYNIDIFHDDYLSDIENNIREKLYIRTRYEADLIFLNLYVDRNKIIDNLHYINEDFYSFKTGMRADYFGFSVKPGYRYYDYAAVSRSITLETSLNDSIRKIIISYKREQGIQLRRKIRCRLSFNTDMFSLYNDSEYETVDEKSVNLKSVFRYETGCRISY